VSETAIEKTGADKADAPKDKPARRGRWKRRLVIVALAIPLATLAMWLAVHNIPGFGPLVADGLRAVFGNDAVAWLEDTAYGVSDWVNRRTRSDEAPAPLWDVPAEATPAPSAAGSARPDEPPPFTLANVGAMHENIATKGDGVWVPLHDPRKPDERPYMLKTFLHPDAGRSWTTVAVVAVDLGRADLHAVAGRHEPENRTPEAKAYERKAVVPKEHFEVLLAAFNGGYKSTHGDYGMHIDGVTLVSPRPKCCVVAKLRDGSLLIRSWEKVAERRGDMVWFRQTPICMFEDGEPNPVLALKSYGWGASSVSGTTVIRRSAVGLSRDGKVLFVGIGDHSTGAAIGHAMNHAGAAFVAQLDVNFSFPKFLLYQYDGESRDKLVAVPLTEGFEFDRDQYVGGRSQRDFFYLTRRTPPSDSRAN
jgi:hypothetical protein